MQTGENSSYTLS